MASRGPLVRPPQGYTPMDPNCAICYAPPSLACDCEAVGLEKAVRQAEDFMMRSVFDDIRAWVRRHAQDYVLEYFRLLSERRKNAHGLRLEQLTASTWYHYNAPPHPNQIADAQAALKRGIDEDWQASVQRYPEVLEYFFGLVSVALPPDHEPAVKDPPLSALSGQRKAPPRRGLAGSGSADIRGGDGRRIRPTDDPTAFMAQPYPAAQGPTPNSRASVSAARRPAALRMPPQHPAYYGE